MGVKHDRSNDSRLCAVERRLADIALMLERSRLTELAELASSDKRFFKRAFLSGLLRGVGMAIGFSILGALGVYVLRLIAESRIPYIAEFIKKIISVIERPC